MRSSFLDADFEALARLWRDFFPERYSVDAELLRQHSVECPTFDWGASSIKYRDGEPIAMCAIKRSAAGLYKVADRDSYHLDFIAYREPLAAAEMLDDVRRLLVFRGASRLNFGQSCRHFFPGCPDDCPKLAEFLQIQGFSAGAAVCDLERDLVDFEPSQAVPSGFRTAVLDDAHREGLLAMLHREFPGRWPYDVSLKIEKEGPQCVVCLLQQSPDGEELVAGFALIQTSTDVLPIGGAVWRQSLGDTWGSLGPIGVSREVRGKGLGLVLLEQGLLELKLRGARQTIIDWTTLESFYGRVGFVPTRRYRSYQLELP